MTDTSDDRVLALVRHSAGISRAGVAMRLGLPVPTVASIVARLLARGEVEERPATPAIGDEDGGETRPLGRRPKLLTIVGPTPYLGLVSWVRGGFRVTLAGFDGAVLDEQRLPGPDQSDDTASLQPALDHLAAALTRSAGPAVMSDLVVAVPAPFQRGTGSAVHPPARPADIGRAGRPRFVAWFRDDPAAALGERLGIPVIVENDANLAALGEFAAGAAVGHDDAVYVRLYGSGVGTGLIVGGRLYRGANGFAGELAHVHVDDDGPLCACGGRGCLCMRLGPPLLRSVQETYGDQVRFADILRMADEGEPGPARILSDLGRLLGRPLADLCTMLNPSAIVLDGRLGGGARFVAGGLREQVDRYAPPVVSAGVEVLTGSLGVRAELHGALHLVRHS